MSWEIEYTNNFENWWQTLTEEQQPLWRRKILRLYIFSGDV